eukprot:18069_1
MDKGFNVNKLAFQCLTLDIMPCPIFTTSTILQCKNTISEKEDIPEYLEKPYTFCTFATSIFYQLSLYKNIISKMQQLSYSSSFYHTFIKAVFTANIATIILSPIQYPLQSLHLIYATDINDKYKSRQRNISFSRLYTGYELYIANTFISSALYCSLRYLCQPFLDKCLDKGGLFPVLQYIAVHFGAWIVPDLITYPLNTINARQLLTGNTNCYQAGRELVNKYGWNSLYHGCSMCIQGIIFTFISGAGGALFLRLIGLIDTKKHNKLSAQI